MGRLGFLYLGLLAAAPTTADWPRGGGRDDDGRAEVVVTTRPPAPPPPPPSSAIALPPCTRIPTAAACGSSSFSICVQYIYQHNGSMNCLVGMVGLDGWYLFVFVRSSL